MNSDKLFYGTLLECTGYSMTPMLVTSDMALGSRNIKTEVLEENVLFVRTKNGFFVPVGNLNPLQIAYLYFENVDGITPGPRANRIFFDTVPVCKGDIIVDAKSLVPYSKTKEEVSILKVQKKIKLEKR